MKNTNLNTIKSTGFKTPNDYFESLDASIFATLAEENLVSKIDSNGFKVPENYFETFDAKVLNRIEKDNSVKVIQMFNWKKAAYFSGIAASVVVAFSIIFTNSNNLTFDDLETASIESYLINEDLNSYDIAPYLNTSELNSSNFVENTLNSSDIEDYLLQNSDVENLITD